jgi:hypothetical protein
MSTTSAVIKRLRASVLRLSQQNVRLERSIQLLMRGGGKNVIPKYPFVVMVWRRLGVGKIDQRAKSFETLDTAHAYAGTILRSTDVKRVQLYCILEDTSRDSQGNVLGFDHGYQQAAAN